MLIEISPKVVGQGASVSKPVVMCDSHALWFVASLPISVSDEDTLFSSLDRGGYHAEVLVDDGSRACESCSPAESRRSSRR